MGVVKLPISLRNISNAIALFLTFLNRSMFSKNRFFWLAAFAGLVLDRLSKFWVVYTFPLTDPPQTLALIPNVFHFTYVVNTW